MTENSTPKLEVGDLVKNPKNGYFWTVTVIDRGWARLESKNGSAHIRTVKEIARFFEVIPKKGDK